MKQLSKALDDIVNIATTTAKNSQISSAGFVTKDLIANTRLARSRQQGIVDMGAIVAMTQTKLYGSLYQIARHGESLEKVEAIDFVKECLTPATFDEAVHMVLRLLNHFPQRQTTKDAIVASDTAMDLLKAGVGLIPLHNACASLRRESSKEDPWPPPSGEITDRAEAETVRYKRLLESLSAPVREALPAPEKFLPVWRQGSKWDEWSEDVRADFVRHHRDWDRAIFKLCAPIYGISVEDFNKECESRAQRLDVTI